MSTASNLADKFGREPGQQTVVVQCRHDVVNMRHRNSIPDDEKKNYHLHDTQATYDQPINRIDRGNLVFTIGDTRFRGTIMDNALPVVDQVNGMARKKTVDERRAQVDYTENPRLLASRLADDIKVIGVTLGATVPNPENEKDVKKQITVRVHGTANLFNNSGATVKPGDTLIWEVPMRIEDREYSDKYPLGFPNARRGGQRPVSRLPQPPRYGRAATKYTLRVKPLRTMDYGFYEQTITGVMLADKKGAYDKVLVSKTGKFALDLKKFLVRFLAYGENGVNPNEAVEALEGIYVKGKHSSNYSANANNLAKKVQKLCKAAFDPTQPETDTNLKDLLASFINLQLDIRSRTLGKAFNYARSGEMIGVLLGVA